MLTASWPTEDVAGNPISDTRLIMGGLIATNAFGVPRTGVLPVSNDPVVTGRAGEMAYNVGEFRAVTSRTGEGVEFVTNDGTEVVATTAAPGANSRIDVIWARCLFPLYADSTAVPVLGVTQGVAAAIPSKPAIPAGALELATAQVPSTAVDTASVVITQTFPFTATAGGMVKVRSTAEMNAWTPADGAHCFNLADSGVYVRSGGAWGPLGGDTGWVTSGALSPASGWDITSYSIRRIGSMIFLRHLYGTRTGSAISVPASGDIGNTPVALLAAGWEPAATFSGGITSGNSGRLFGGYVSSNAVEIGSVAGSGNIDTGANISLAGSWLRG